MYKYHQEYLSRPETKNFNFAFEISYVNPREKTYKLKGLLCCKIYVWYFKRFYCERRKEFDSMNEQN